MGIGTFALKWVVAPVAIVTVAVSSFEALWDTGTKKADEGDGLSEQFIGNTVENIVDNSKAGLKHLGKATGVYDPEKGVISGSEATRKAAEGLESVADWLKDAGDQALKEINKEFNGGASVGGVDPSEMSMKECVDALKEDPKNPCLNNHYQIDPI